MLKATIVLLLLMTQAGLAQGPSATTPETAEPEAVAIEQGPPADQGGAPPPWAIPRYRLLREDEDWSFLADPQMRGHDWADPLKYIPLGPHPNWYLTLGGQMREWFEHYHNEFWGVPPVQPAFNTAFATEPTIEDNGYL